MLVDVLTAEDILDIIVIFFFSFVGSFAKVYLKMMRMKDGEKHSFNFIEVLLSTFTASIVVFAFSIYIESHFTIRGLVIVSFIAGLVGFELLVRISSINGIMSLLVSVVDLYNSYCKISNEKSKETEDTKYD